MSYTIMSSETQETAVDGQRYPFQAIERKWQKRWTDADVYRTQEGGDRPKYYVLTMFPYPSGSGLHVGHCKNYVPGDVVARFRRMQGCNVLHPMGWDAFGQPAEQDAIKRNVNPKDIVPQLAAEYRRQLSLLGISYDWNREINSTDPAYYKWNQWAFLLLLERGLAYRKNAPVNWCVNESTILANEEVVDGMCWRCDGPVIKRDLPQWLFRITEYADKLIEGLDRIAWPEGIKTQQRDWIGRSEGAEVTFSVVGSGEPLTVFTTRPDTLWGATFMVIAPEHPLVDAITTPERRAAVEAYRAAAQRTSDLDRTAEGREKTGVFTGAYATNPVNGQPIPIWVADYVLMGYGTGAIMAVPAHDQRDFEFARKFDLPVVPVYAENETQTAEEMTVALPTGGTFRAALNAPFTGEPNGKETVRKVIRWLEAAGIGQGRVNYKLRDWLVSRQRYWGTPIPVIHCPDCGIVPVPFEDLPVVLPDVESYQPGPDGSSPLASIPEFVHVRCPKCGGDARRETDTMAGSVDSSWYFLRYTSPHDAADAWTKTAADYWMPVDLYLGGREHAVGHLLYARFFTKVFFDAGLISVDEPATELRNQGMLLGWTPVEKESGHPIKPDELSRFTPDRIEYQWLKMSKSKGNSVTPDEMAEKYGADALRLYVLFEAPYEDTIQWSEERMSGTFRFLARTWDSVTQVAASFDRAFADKLADAVSPDEKALRRKTHQTIQRTQEAIAELRFNTAVSGLMIHADALRKFTAANGAASPAAHEAAVVLTKLLAPFAPHIADELNERLGGDGVFLLNAEWPTADPSVAAEEEITLVVQVNGKLRDRITLPADADEATCRNAALASEKVREFTGGNPPKKVIVIPGKLVNIVA
ncbi:MAG: leucine--tRNA ligase [Capsulimonadales bacterium]|nr:leucine--tRNA ligase [Capsulimonadales bacterium]